MSEDDLHAWSGRLELLGLAAGMFGVGLGLQHQRHLPTTRPDVWVVPPRRPLLDELKVPAVGAGVAVLGLALGLRGLVASGAGLVAGAAVGSIFNGAQHV